MLRKIFKILSLVTIFLPQIVFSEIGYFKNTDDFTGEDKSRVIMSGNNDKIAIIIQCISDELRMLFMHEELIGNKDNQIMIAYKVDDGLPSDFNNSNILNPRTLSFLGILSAIPAVNQMLKPDTMLLSNLQGASELSIRIVDPYDNNQLTTSFLLTGLRKEILKLSCVPSDF